MQDWWNPSSQVNIRCAKRNRCPSTVWRQTRKRRALHLVERPGTEVAGSRKRAHCHNRPPLLLHVISRLDWGYHIQYRTTSCPCAGAVEVEEVGLRTRRILHISRCSPPYLAVYISLHVFSPAWYRRRIVLRLTGWYICVHPFSSVESVHGLSYGLLCDRWCTSS